MKNTKVGITGSNGVLGKITCDYLSSKNIDWDGFDGDICDLTQVNNWVQNGEFTHIIHYASIVSIQDVSNDPLMAYRVNVGGVLNVIDAIKNCSDNAWLFLSSSSHVYNSGNTSKQNEHSDLKPKGVYGKTKLMAEHLCLSVAPEVGVRVCVGRIFSFYHSSQKGSFLFPNILKRLRVEDMSKVFKLNGGESVRDISSAESIVSKIACLLDKEYVGIVNIGSGYETKIKEFVANVAKELHEREITIESVNDDLSYLVADMGKYNDIFSEKG